MGALDYGLEGKVAVITGAASGIGRATAELFSGQGAVVVASDVNADAGAETVERLRQAGGSVLFVAADVSDNAALRAVLDRAVQEHGRVDCAATARASGPVTARRTTTTRRRGTASSTSTCAAHAPPCDTSPHQSLPVDKADPSSTSPPRSASVARRSAPPTPPANTASSV